MSFIRWARKLMKTLLRNSKQAKKQQNKTKLNKTQLNKTKQTTNRF